MPTIETTQDKFDAEVVSAGKPALVDVWAPWCGPCRAVHPILEALAEEHEGIAFTKVNIDDNPGYASRYGVLSIPTVILFENGEPQETIIGARPRGCFEKAWERWLS